MIDRHHPPIAKDGKWRRSGFLSEILAHHTKKGRRPMEKWRRRMKKSRPPMKKSRPPMRKSQRPIRKWQRFFRKRQKSLVELGVTSMQVPEWYSLLSTLLQSSLNF